MVEVVEVVEVVVVDLVKVRDKLEDSSLVVDHRIQVADVTVVAGGETLTFAVEWWAQRS
jgi:hypothetical protein